MSGAKNFFLLSICATWSMCATVGPVIPGQPKWGLAKRIGDTTSIIASKVCIVESAICEIETFFPSLVCINTTVLDVQVSQLDDIFSELSLIEENICSLLDITFAGCARTEISGATTISAAGSYCLTSTIDGAIIIDADDVTLDLNGYTVEQIEITSNKNHISIANGFVDAQGLDGILVNQGASDITIEQVQVSNALRGIYFDNVDNAKVHNCTLSFNTTGMQLEQSYNVSVEKSYALSNLNVGFELLSSSTNCFVECKALSTGFSNEVVLNNSVAGFISSNGYGNIFERCIANGTQALATTDSSSLIAGFALRGTEQCSKIIDSESANAIASSDGVTVPYGMVFESTTTQNIIKNNLVYCNQHDVMGTTTGIGISDASSCNLIIGNIAYNNAQNYEFVTNIFDPDTQNAPSALQNISLQGCVPIQTPQDITLLLKQTLVKACAFEAIVPSFEQIQADIAILQNNCAAESITTATTISQPGAYQVCNSFTGLITIASSDVDLNLNTYAIGGVVVNANLEHISISNGTINASTDDGILVNAGSKDITIQNVFVHNAVRGIHFDTVDAGMIEKCTLTQNFTGLLLENTVNMQIVHTVAQSNVHAGFDLVSSFTNCFIECKALSTGFSNEVVLNNTVAGFVSSNGFGNIFERCIANGTQAVATTDADSLVAGFALRGTEQCSKIIDSESANATASADGVTIPYGMVFESTTTQNIIRNNLVYCNQHDVMGTTTGIGISDASSCNLVIGNSAYNNAQNYEFVSNVFDPTTQVAPTALQNISLDGCVPISQPQDIDLLLKQTLQKACDMQLVVEAFGLSLFDVPALTSCASTPIETSQTISTAGSYCLANDVSSLTINASQVSVDLNGYKVSDGITVNGGFSAITIENGVVEGTTDGIIVNAGTSDVTIQNVSVKNAIRGIHFENVDDATIDYVTLSNNTTGLQLDSCVNITVNKSRALNNTQAGFELLNSSTCIVTECKALSTGIDNTNLFGDESNVFGFVANQCFGTIFERCIANATQNLSATAYDTIVAGFALLGTGTQCNKIIECEAANATAGGSGVTVPYGILLQGTISSLTTITVLDGITTAVAWSPDGNYIAADREGFSESVYAFDRITHAITRIADFNTQATIRSFDWSADGQYIAVGSNSLTSKLEIYSFDRISQQLILVDGFLSGASTQVVESVSWSSNGKYLAIGGSVISGNELQIYFFDRVAQKATFIIGLFDNPNVGEGIATLDWSPDGQYIAAGGTEVTPTNELQIIFFNPGGPVATVVAEAFASPSSIFSVAWSPDGHYLAVGGSGLTGGNEFQIVRFDRSTNELTSVAGEITGGVVQSVAWSSDGKYVAMSGSGFSGNKIRIFEFDRASQELIPAGGILPTPVGSINSLSWSPDGEYIVLGGDILFSSAADFAIITALQFPSANIITNNTVYCNGHDVSATFTGTVGFGISGSSIANFITRNKAFNNAFNYAFVTNVFNQLFQQGPTLLQNIGKQPADPILIPDDFYARLQRTILLAESLVDNLL